MNDNKDRKRRSKRDMDTRSLPSTSDDRSFTSDEDSRCEERRHRKRKKERKKKKEKKKRKSKGKRKYQADSDSDDYSERHHKRERKRRRKESKKHCSSNNNDKNDPPASNQSVAVIQALHSLLQEKPEFSSELPIILIRLAGGATFDLRQVTDPSVAFGLQSLFEALTLYGVKKDDNGMWMFQPPPGASRRDALVLLRVILSVLNDVGLTMGEIACFEQNLLQQEQESSTKPTPGSSRTKGLEQSQAKNQEIKQSTMRLLTRFQSSDSELGLQLASLCQLIAQGESVSLDGILDEALKEALQSLFDECGLEKSEMEDSDESGTSSDDDEDSGPLMGYALPENADELVQINLAAIMAACRAEEPHKRRPVGPMRQPMTDEEMKEATELYAASTGKEEEEEEDEDEGPMLPGMARKVRGPTLPPDVIQAQAAHRELQLKATAAGVPMPLQGGREEWMVVPGKYDFLSSIKSGQPMKSRGFQNKKSKDDDKPVAAIHPAVQAEMDAILQAHQDARGPSLMDQHRAIKSKEREAAASGGKKKDFQWSRDKNLDDGRRVDKDALGMILGGASDNLKTKFHGGFNH